MSFVEGVAIVHVVAGYIAIGLIHGILGAMIDDLFHASRRLRVFSKPWLRVFLWPVFSAYLMVLTCKKSVVRHSGWLTIEDVRRLEGKK